MKRRDFLKSGLFTVPGVTAPRFINNGGSQDTADSGEPDRPVGDSKVNEYRGLNTWVIEESDIPDSATVYDASTFNLRDAPGFSEALEKHKPELEPDSYTEVELHPDGKELDKHIAKHSPDASITSYFDLTERGSVIFFDFGEFYLRSAQEIAL